MLKLASNILHRSVAFSRLSQVPVCLIHSTTVNKMPIKVGDSLPDVELFETTPANKVKLSELTAGKKAVVFAVPGAFTPGCSKTHLPGYVEDFDKIKSKGVDVVACISVNDPFVMDAWGKANGADGKIRMLADPGAAFTKAVDLSVDLTGPLGSVRSKRYAMIVQDGKVKALEVEPDGTGLTCSLSSAIVDKL